VDRGVIATASELLQGRHYPSVVAICADALDAEPECVPLLLLRARAHVALRCELEAQADLRDIIRLEPNCALAYRLLGELAARRDEHEHAAVFFREALRLDPGDRVAADWLRVSESSLRPAAVATKLPASATAAGRVPALDARHSHESVPRFARGTQQPDGPARAYDPYHPYDERPTKPFARGSERQGSSSWAPTPSRTPTPLPASARRADASVPPQELRPQRAPTADLADAGAPDAGMPLDNSKHGEFPTIRGRAVSDTPPAKPAPRLAQKPMTRSSIPELPGFGEYLVSAGILTRERLRAAQAYQRSMKVQLSTAIVTLGLATPQRIEWAAVAHQTQLARGQ